MTTKEQLEILQKKTKEIIENSNVNEVSKERMRALLEALKGEDNDKD